MYANPQRTSFPNKFWRMPAFFIANEGKPNDFITRAINYSDRGDYLLHKTANLSISEFIEELKKGNTIYSSVNLFTDEFTIGRVFNLEW